MIPLALIEDDAPLREMLAQYLAAQPEFRVMAAVDSVEDFLAEVGRLTPTPRLILCDIGLPGVTGIAGLPRLRQRLPSADVVMFTVFTDAPRVMEALRAGAVGYLEKATPPEGIKEALLQVAGGGSPMSPAVARHVVRYFQPTPLQEQLTPREWQVIRAVEEGLSHKLVADRLGLSLETVRNHLRAVYRKLEVHSQSEALARLRTR